MGYSETAFVEAQGSRGQYRVRYFSPQAEVAFCGHATIAAAVAIARVTSIDLCIGYSSAAPGPWYSGRQAHYGLAVSALPRWQWE